MKRNFLPLMVLCFIGWLLYCNNATDPRKPEPIQKSQKNEQIIRLGYVSSDLEDDIFTCIALAEGFVSQPYYCGGWAVGYGSSFYADGTPVTKFSRNITKDEARTCMITHLRKRVYPSIQRSVKRKLNDSEYIACCMLIYNIGEGAFEKSSFLTALNKHASPEECVQEMAKHNKVKGQTWTVLQQRRWFEGALFCGYITPDDVRKMRSNAIYSTNVVLLYHGKYLNYSEDTIKSFLQRNYV